MNKYNIKMISGTRNTSGDGTAILAALAAGQRRVIVGWQFQSEDDAINTALLKSGATTKLRWTTTAAPISTGPNFIPPEYGGVTMGNAEATYINLSANKAMSYTLWYYDESE